MPKGSRAVTDRLMHAARPTDDNAFKVSLVERTLAAAIADAKAA